MVKKPPPQVKPSFYKNPSKAIEKGGGFYIPGLRGPRLRYFVSAVSAALLTLNHVTSSQTPTPYMTTSEALGAFATLAVLTTAIADTSADSGKVLPYTGDNLPRRAVVAPVFTDGNRNLDTSKNSTNSPVDWALSTCTELTATTHVAAFRSNSIVVATENVDTSESPGEIVRRVRQESRALYIADTSDLPKGIDLPFFGPGPWSAFVVPVNEGAVVFAAPVSTDSNNRSGSITKMKYSIEDRRWLEMFASRLLEQ